MIEHADPSDIQTFSGKNKISEIEALGILKQVFINLSFAYLMLFN